MIYTLICIMTIDIITGVLCATRKKGNKGILKSRTFVNGIYRKVATICICLMCKLLGDNLGYDDIFNYVSAFFVFGECISVCENSVKLGVKLPKKLMQLFKDETEDK